jgi:hypothetical protein
MLMPEDFDRCEKCEEGWFNRVERVLVRKGSPKGGKPDILKREILYVCSRPNCRHIQYRHIEEE